ANNARFALEWSETRRFWQHVIWRVPGLEDGATLTGFRTTPIYEGYFIWSPANLLYRPPALNLPYRPPDKDVPLPLSAEVLNPEVLRSIVLNEPYEKELRS